MINQEILKLMRCFPRSFMNQNGEIIFHERSNTYFKIADCKNELDIKCKILEWLSRPAHKETPYNRNDKNLEFQSFILNGVNLYLKTDFTKNDMELIYIELGNRVNHELTIKFVESNYDLTLLS